MAVKLELYRVFHEVARMGNISAAAQNLFISQSAVSQSIKQLEEQLQVRLFSRSTKGVYLTSEGKLLQEYISHALGLIQSGEEKLAQSRQLLTGELIIGASDTVTKTYLLSRLEAFHRDYPDIRIRILNGTSHMVLDYLHAGQVDIAFASDDQDPAVYDVRHCVDTHTDLCRRAGLPVRFFACVLDGGDCGVPADSAGAQGKLTAVSRAVFPAARRDDSAGNRARLA